MPWLRLIRGGKTDGREPLAPALDVGDDGEMQSLLAAALAPGSSGYAHLCEHVTHWSPADWLRLDAMRLGGAYGWAERSLRGWSDWSTAIEGGQASPLLLVLASTHHGGHVRELATRRLVAHRTPLASAAIAVRTHDHVQPIRDLALAELRLRTESGHAAVIVPILLASRNRLTGAAACADYLPRLSDSTARGLAQSADVTTRRYAFERAPFTATELVDAAASEADQRCRMIAARRVLDMDASSASALLSIRSAGVRALAVEAAPAEVIRPYLGTLLSDRRPSLRRTAQLRARSLGIDVAAMYRAQLPATEAVRGLGETGRSNDVDRLLPLADEPNSLRTRRAAIAALQWLAPSDVMLSILPPLLESDEPGLIKDASRLLRRSGYTPSPESLDRWLTSPTPSTRRAALTLGLQWEGLIAGLALYNDPESELQQRARRIVGEGYGAGPRAGFPTDGQKQRLRIALDHAHVPPDTDRLIRFFGRLDSG